MNQITYIFSPPSALVSESPCFHIRLVKETASYHQHVIFVYHAGRKAFLEFGNYTGPQALVSKNQFHSLVRLDRQIFLD